MNVLIALSHPAHYYLFKYLSIGLKDKSHEVRFVIKEKDILEEILKKENIQYTKICKAYNRGKNKFSIILVAIFEMIIEDFNLFKYIREWRPDILIGTDISIAHIGRLTGVKSFVFNEDDFKINKLFCMVTYPWASYIISPNNCDVGKYKFKKIGYDGYQKMAYTHPKYFKTNESILRKYNLINRNYFLIRLVSLNAVHDVEKLHNGLSESILYDIIKVLKPHGRILINAEGNFPTDYKEYQMKINPIDIHHVIAGARLFIGDSQTMAAEAGLLGTPFIRFNDFVGEIQYLNDIENKYKLGWGIKTSDRHLLIPTIEKVIKHNNIKEEWVRKKEKLFNEKINVTDFWIWLFDNYPGSLSELDN